MQEADQRGVHRLGLLVLDPVGSPPGSVRAGLRDTGAGCRGRGRLRGRCRARPTAPAPAGAPERGRPARQPQGPVPVQHAVRAPGSPHSGPRRRRGRRRRRCPAARRREGAAQDGEAAGPQQRLGQPGHLEQPDIEAAQELARVPGGKAPTTSGCGALRIAAARRPRSGWCAAVHHRRARPNRGRRGRSARARRRRRADRVAGQPVEVVGGEGPGLAAAGIAALVGDDDPQARGGERADLTAPAEARIGKPCRSRTIGPSSGPISVTSST